MPHNHHVTEGQIVSRSCTTSWLDWSHGELVVTDHALVRRRLVQPTEQGGKLRSTASATERPTDVPDPGRAQEVLGLHSTNKYILFSEIGEAKLRRGILSHRLAINTIGGATHKWFWLSADPAHWMLADRLPQMWAAGSNRTRPHGATGGTATSGVSGGCPRAMVCTQEPSG
jgi:hypothetical protein